MKPLPLLFVAFASLHLAAAPLSFKPLPMQFGDTTRRGVPYAKDPTVIRRGGTWYLFYAGAYNHERQQIGLATSTDGFHFTRVGDGLVYPCGRAGEWNAAESGHPGIFEDDDGRVYMFYQGKASLNGDYHLSCAEVLF